MKKIAGILAVVLVVMSLGLVQARAIGNDAGAPCYETKTIHHEAVGHIHKVLVTPAVPAVPAVPEVWANFSPNHNQRPFDGPPSYPNDSRGTWHIHNKIPGGHVGPDGVYQRDNPGNGNADWFYRQNGQDEIPGKDAVYREEYRIDRPAWDEVIKVEVPCGAVVTFVDPAWRIKVDCYKPRLDWVIPTPSAAYTFTKRALPGRLVEITFTANTGYAFKPSDRYTVSDDGHYAVVQVTTPVVRCAVPKTPEIGVPQVNINKSESNTEALPNTGA